VWSLCAHPEAIAVNRRVLRARFLLFTLALCLATPIVSHGSSAADGRGRQTIVLDSASVAGLLERPGCLGTYVDSARTCVVEPLSLPGKGVTLSGELYLPSREGRWPVVILVPGGFNETELIMLSPRYYAPRFAACGFAAYVFYKRGTGPSGGVWADAAYDDFIDDVVGIAEALAKHPNIDTTRIGIQGGSSGALVGAVAAARSRRVAFVISNSGPLVSWEEESNFNMEYALHVRGFPDSSIHAVMPLWHRHHAAWARGDAAAHAAVAAEVYELREKYPAEMLPTPYQEFFADSGLAFMWPRWRSAQRDYLSELKHIRAKWLCIYGEKDPIVPVTSCVNNLEALIKENRTLDCTVIVLPGVDHSFSDPKTGIQVPVMRIMVNWLAEALSRN
jgi:pimeloyl-ACP methyl ester carboxylesterase